MNNINKVYPMSPPGLMRPDSEETVETNCGSVSGDMDRSCIDNMPLAMAYVPMQKWQCIYEDSKAIMRGTIFEELDLPFKGAGKR